MWEGGGFEDGASRWKGISGEREGRGGVGLPSRQFCADLDFAEFDANFVFGVDAGTHDGVDDGAEGVVGDGDAGGLVGRGAPRQGVIPASQNMGHALGSERGV